MCSTVGYVGVMNTLECRTNYLLVAIPVVECVQ